MRSARVLLALASSMIPITSSCRVPVRHEIARSGAVERTRRSETVTGRPTVVLDDDGRLRFVEPLACATDERVVMHRAIEHSSRPNMATFVIGIIATAAGGITLATVLGKPDRARDPLTYVGAGSLVVGLTLSIGSWIPTRARLEPLPDGPPLLRRGPNEPCGERPLSARTATIATRGIELYGAIASDGTFAISPYAVVDAFQTKHVPALDITATVDTPHGRVTIDTVVDANALASKAAKFLGSADFDARIDPMRLVPNLEPGTLRLSLSSQAGVPAVRVVLPLSNAGPGPSYALRGTLAAPGQPAVDGRIIYIGHVPKGATVTRELFIPLSPASAETLRNATIDLAIELRDAHGTAPASPVRFRGPLLVDAPR